MSLTTTPTTKHYVTVMHRCGCTYSWFCRALVAVEVHRLRQNHMRRGTGALVFATTEPTDWTCPLHDGPAL
jgi:hypothetical protein